MKELYNWVEKNKHLRSKLFFVQIGANDGISKGGINSDEDDPDPVYGFVQKYGWSGILVEPVKYIFEELKKNYKTAKNIKFENVAICKGYSFRHFYRIKKSNIPLPWFYEKLGTFYLDVLLKEKDLPPGIEKYIVKEKVKCIGLHDLFNKYKVTNVDLLVMDTEGHDFEILKEVEFERIHPRAILMEHKHLSSSEFIQCKELLLSEQYKFFYDERDIFACCDHL